jgi:S-adenosylmethionine:tRNA ribosyltransferase-isomerase
MRTDEFDYHLPQELIAQDPAPERPQSRLMVVNRSDGSISHHTFRDVGRFLRPGDALVANRTRVIPARIAARRITGGAVELLLIERQSQGCWRALARPSRKLRPGEELKVAGSPLVARLDRLIGDGEWVVTFSGAPDIDATLMGAGSLPLPPYITNPAAPRDRYQTVYADRDGSIAAPTAGLHFDERLLETLRRSGVLTEFVTLHVGLGTFKPVTSERIEEHHIHAEWGEVPDDVARRLNEARRSGGRVVAVGTTTTRLLESAANGEIRPFCGETSIFIYPGHRFRAIDALVTNFHLPRSTLLMLVSAFAGRELIVRAYDEAVRERYRFYSFGDAMLIL